MLRYPQNIFFKVVLISPSFEHYAQIVCTIMYNFFLHIHPNLDLVPPMVSQTPPNAQYPKCIKALSFMHSIPIPNSDPKAFPSLNLSIFPSSTASHHKPHSSNSPPTSSPSATQKPQSPPARKTSPPAQSAGSTSPKRRRGASGGSCCVQRGAFLGRCPARRGRL